MFQAVDLCRLAQILCVAAGGGVGALLSEALPHALESFRTVRRVDRSSFAFNRFRTTLCRLLDPFHEPAEPFPFGTVKWIGKGVDSLFPLLANQLSV
ncbi:hypothetical protein [Ensifer aridi]|uniref:hypothetical protein n=1 Tax=Ensifer aridi TaxID=1708715 RepID=UPI00358EF60E